MNPTARGTGVLFFYVFFFSFFLFLPQSIVDDRNRSPISAVPPDIILISKSADLLLLANSFITQVSETYFGYKEVWKLLMKSMLRLLVQDFPREGPQPFKLAGIGGVSEFLG
ncbi:hypothetical protein BHM03_00028009 [Ensete ventricosum]|nr:hypothetical protein BHM03_00028009 [Ensete ventricosum]